MTTFTINGKKYTAKLVDYNFVCNLEEAGIDIAKFTAKPAKLIREYLAFCGGLESEEAGEEINQHIISGGDMSEAYSALNWALEESDFFRALVKTEEPEEKKPKKK